MIGFNCPTHQMFGRQRQSSIDYAPKVENRRHGNDKPLFRGFLSGVAFMTKKGYRGTKLDSLWTKQIFDSFKNDDTEILDVALQSVLADVESRVIGGDFGAPFMIGECGFYAKSQFQQLGNRLKQKAHHLGSASVHFLTENEWKVVDEKLDDIATHGYHNFNHAVRGDSFASLAVRSDAFCVALSLLNKGIDPLVANEDGEDFVTIIQQQSNKLSADLKRIENEMVDAQTNVLVPSKAKELEDREAKALSNYRNLIALVEAVTTVLEQRLLQIDQFRWLKKRAQLRKEVGKTINDISWVVTHMVETLHISQTVSAEIQWNIDQGEKAEKYIEVCLSPRHATMILVLTRYLHSMLDWSIHSK